MFTIKEHKFEDLRTACRKTDKDVTWLLFASHDSGLQRELLDHSRLTEASTWGIADMEGATTQTVQIGFKD